MMHAFPYRGAPLGRGLIDGPMHDGLFFPFAGWLVGFLVTAAIVALVVWLIVRASRHGAGSAHAVMPAGAPPAPSPADDALRIARERLARGEIDVEQYRSIVQALTT
ncbi:hypothetical protein MX659_03275 [Coriobacteriia bacterium Es71-Z0120]|uniref:hypothetical protein n=1 Tax=Parvivirga hydrogeniphila TaxID=2939460 RepID=UPI002260A506|nr:hypothetical protein [Parvivirga hydrogeniphila]MCL4078622.1 hypothetical protein [Parvivirga hydrogeniphila]